MKKLILSLSTFTLLLFYSPVLTQAQTTTSAPTESIRDSVKKQVDEELSQIKKAVAKKAFVGSISAKNDGQITITNLTNQSRLANVTADVTIKLTTGKDGTPSDLKIGDFVIAMGDVDSTNLMTVKRLLVIKKPVEDKTLTIFGTVTKASSSSLTVETLDKQTYTVKLQSATKFTKLTKASDVKVDSKIVVVGLTTADTALTARVIHLFAK